MRISHERAERIVRAHACEHCGEYTYKSLKVKAATGRIKSEMNVAWHAVMMCGVCGLQQEIGLDEEGEIVFVG